MKLKNQGGVTAQAPLVAASVGASQASGFGFGLGSMASLANSVLPAQTGALKTLRLADYSTAGVNTGAVYQGQWLGLAGPTALAAKGDRSRYLVVVGDELVNDARAASPPSVLAVVATLKLLFEEALAQGDSVIFLSGYPFGDESSVTTQQTDYLGAASALLLQWCEQAQADGQRVLSSDAAKIVADVTSYAYVVDVNCAASVGPVGLKIGGVPVTVTATAGADGATATALAAALTSAFPAISSTVVATTFVELSFPTTTGFVDIRPLGVGPVPSAQVFGTNPSRTNLPVLQAGYQSGTPGHANRAGADALANEVLRLLNLAYAKGW